MSMLEKECDCDTCENLRNVARLVAAARREALKEAANICLDWARRLEPPHDDVALMMADVLLVKAAKDKP